MESDNSTKRTLGSFRERRLRGTGLITPQPAPTFLFTLLLRCTTLLGRRKTTDNRKKIPILTEVASSGLYRLWVKQELLRYSCGRGLRKPHTGQDRRYSQRFTVVLQHSHIVDVCKATPSIKPSRPLIASAAPLSPPSNFSSSLSGELSSAGGRMASVILGDRKGVL